MFKRTPKTPDEKRLLRNDRFLLIASGAALAAGFPPSPFPFLLFFGLVPYLIVALRRETLLAVNRATYLMSLSFSVFALYWVGAYTQARDPYLMLGGLLLFFVNPIAFLLPSTALHITRKYLGRGAALAAFPFFWVAYEYLYTLTDWSFPWLNLGNGICNFNLFIQCADIIGAFGLSALIVSINVALFMAYERRHMRGRAALYAGGAALGVLIPVVYGLFTAYPIIIKEPKIAIGVVQPNLDPYDKWAGDNADQILKTYLDEGRKLAAQNADMIILPETALPVYLLAPGRRYMLDSLRSFVRQINRPLLTGMPDLRYYEKGGAMPPDAKPLPQSNTYITTYNAIYLFRPDSSGIQRYGKMKLVPFGERVPFVDAIPLLGDLMRWSVGIGAWNVGRDTVVFTAPCRRLRREVKIGGVVCYESIYGDLAAGLTARGAEFLTVVTNDSWYGKTSGPYQHRDYAKLRAVENRRFVVRAANGGVSCVIDPQGRIESETPMYERTTFQALVSPRQDLTFYARRPHLAAHLALLVSALTLVTAAMAKFGALRFRKK